MFLLKDKRTSNFYQKKLLNPNILAYVTSKNVSQLGPAFWQLLTYESYKKYTNIHIYI